MRTIARGIYGGNAMVAYETASCSNTSSHADSPSAASEPATDRAPLVGRPPHHVPAAYGADTAPRPRAVAYDSSDTAGTWRVGRPNYRRSPSPWLPRRVTGCQRLVGCLNGDALLKPLTAPLSRRRSDSQGDRQVLPGAAAERSAVRQFKVESGGRYPAPEATGGRSRVLCQCLSTAAEDGEWACDEVVG